MSQGAHAKDQAAVSLGVMAVGLGMATGALSIPSEAGYAGVGPNFLPWVVSLALMGLGAMLLREALTGGFRQLDDDTGGARPCWIGFAWISAGLLVNAAVITSVGFVLGCGLCFMLSAQGLRYSIKAGASVTPPSSSLSVRLAKDLLTGVVISAPVFWMFTKLLAIKLPGLTSTGWI